jgi:3,4-dihydroxy 2-butanone 4-phosphate synthase / GTP cyclohydrolase II
MTVSPPVHLPAFESEHDVSSPQQRPPLKAGAATHWQSKWGYEVQARTFSCGGQRVIALCHGDPAQGETAPLVRVHSACLTSESLGSTRCDCREQLDDAMRRIGEEGRGLLLYFVDHEGRGIGLEAKMEAYALQDLGHDTTQANVLLGHPVDARDFHLAAMILEELDILRIRLMTNNPAKIETLVNAGIEVERTSAWVQAHERAQGYLKHKRTKMAHLR